jgi:putative phage tail fibre protein (fragment)|nr:tail fiber protein [Aggregatibacter kilianii]DAX70478.1 MAG TPA: tail collar fiber protein [Caudoviricetes sp.]
MKTLLPEINSADKRFHAGNPATGEQGTRVTDTWLNDVQDRVRDVQAEAHYVLQKAGFQPVGNKQTQLYEAIVKIIDDNRKTASLIQEGEVQLSSSTNSNSETQAATPKAVKAAYDLAISKQSPATTLAGYGIGNFKVENFVGNVNTLQTDGIYAVTQASRSQNLPVAGNGCHIQVIAGGDGRWCRQIAYIAYSTDMYERHQTSYHTESWSAWVKIDSLDKIPNSKKSSAVNSESEDTVATSKAAKTAYDKGVEAKSAADTAQRTANDANNNANTRQLKSELVGEVAFFARQSPPSGWLKANGAVLSRTTYAELFAAIGTTFGAGDGRTTFNLPDLRGEFIRGLDDGRNIDGGRRLGTAQGDAIKTHTITVPNSGFEGSVQGTWFYAESGNGNNNQRENTITYNGANETRPRNIALLACIKY